MDKEKNIKRRSGKSTRVLDRCIQEFFTKGKTYLYDETRLFKATEKLLERFKLRMKQEHPGVKFNYRGVKEEGINCFLIESHNL